MKNLVICGCSFAKGIGCVDLNKSPFGILLSEKLNLNHISLAKGSSSNFSIYLQAKYVVEKLKDVELVILSVTSYDRTEWMKETLQNDEYFKKFELESGELSNTNVNYHQYPPHGEASYSQILPFYMEDDPTYTGEMFTENYVGIFDYIDNFIDKNRSSTYYARFDNERPDRTKILKDYFLNIVDLRIKRMYDVGMINLACNLFDQHDMKYLILTDDHIFNQFISSKNLVNVSWGELSIHYPDSLKSAHTGEAGHKIVFEKISEKMKINEWY
jgi:hypothetical protein